MRDSFVQLCALFVNKGFLWKTVLFVAEGSLLTSAMDLDACRQAQFEEQQPDIATRALLCSFLFANIGTGLL